MLTMTGKPRLALLALATLLALACSDKSGTAGKTENKAAAPKGAPKITATAQDFDFGKVKEGADVEHVFKITNKGTANLVIESARGS